MSQNFQPPPESPGEEGGTGALTAKPKLTLSIGEGKRSLTGRPLVAQGRSKTVTVEVKRRKVQLSHAQQMLGGESPSAHPPVVAPDGRPFSQSEWEARQQALKASLIAQEEPEEISEEGVNKELPSEEPPELGKKEDDVEVLELHREEIASLVEEAHEPLVPVLEEGIIPDVESEVAVSPRSMSFRERAAQVSDVYRPVVPPRPVASPVSNVEKAKTATAETEGGLRKKKEGVVEEEESKAKKGAKKTPSLHKREYMRGTQYEDLVADEEDPATPGVADRRLRVVVPKRMRAPTRHKSTIDKKPTQKIFREVVIPDSITVQDLANRMAERSADVIKTLMKMGMMVTVTQAIDGDTAELIVTELGHIPRRVSDADIEIGLGGVEDALSDLVSRPPVVTIMGHVDHGKTSLLDALRSTDVALGEAGGITQHIGAYQVQLSSGDKITFIDTPGHAAFTQMRARGAHVTDLVVLVVAADDGIMEQTVEAISHAQAAGVPILVAINKCDKPDANPGRVRQELLQYGLVVEELGGDVLDVEVSALTKMGLDKLEEAILLQAEVLDLKANPNRPAEGVVIEARLEKGRGAIATVLVEHGTLRSGDIFVAGTQWGSVRTLVDDHDRKVEKAVPGMAVAVMGFSGAPSAGDKFLVVPSEDRAREITEFRHRKEIEAKNVKKHSSLEHLFHQLKEGVVKELPLLIKADVHGSLEAIRTALEKLSTDEVRIRVVHGGVGAIHESDVILARATGGLIVGFNVRATPTAREMAQREKLDIRYYSIIYNLLDDMKQVLSGLLAPEMHEKFLGYAEIREVFNITKVGPVAGCMITEGTVKRGAKVRLLRDNVVIHEGTLKTLRRFKDEVKEAREGFECGMAFENYQDIRVGDRIECFEVEVRVRSL